MDEMQHSQTAPGVIRVDRRYIMMHAEQMALIGAINTRADSLAHQWVMLLGEAAPYELAAIRNTIDSIHDQAKAEIVAVKTIPIEWGE